MVASFVARFQCLISAERRSAAPRLASCSMNTSRIGNRDRVYAAVLCQISIARLDGDLGRDEAALLHVVRPARSVALGLLCLEIAPPSGARESRASATISPPGRPLQAATVRKSRPHLLGLAFAALVGLARCLVLGAARDRHPLASGGVPRLLDLEVETSRARASAGGLRAESPHPEDVIRQPALGRAQNPRRAPQAGLRHLATLGRPADAASSKAALSVVENLPRESPRSFRRLLRRAYGDVPDPLCLR